MTFCNSISLVKTKPWQKKITPLPCRSWGCADCAPIRRKQLQAQAFGGNPTKFLTLTINTSEFPDPVTAAKALANAWRNTVKRAKREAARDPNKRPDPMGATGDYELLRQENGTIRNLVKLTSTSIPFLAVFERTKKGWPHLHILARFEWMDQRWLSAQMADLLGSPIVDVRHINSKGAAVGYVTKYVTKEPTHFATCKRYWSSRDYDQRDPYEPTAKDGPWDTVEVVMDPAWAIADQLRGKGWLIQQNDDEYLAHDYWRKRGAALPP